MKFWIFIAILWIAAGIAVYMHRNDKFPTATSGNIYVAPELPQTSVR